VQDSKVNFLGQGVKKIMVRFSSIRDQTVPFKTISKFSLSSWQVR